MIHRVIHRNCGNKRPALIYLAHQALELGDKCENGVDFLDEIFGTHHPRGIGATRAVDGHWRLHAGDCGESDYFLLRDFLAVFVDFGSDDFGTETICDRAALKRSNGVKDESIGCVYFVGMIRHPNTSYSGS
jgi:hypothetical protein